MLCAFQDLADAGLIVDRAGQVDVAAPRCCRLEQALELGIVVNQPQGDRAACGHAVVNARIDMIRSVSSFWRFPRP